MRAARLHGPGDLRVEAIEPPAARSGEMVLDVIVALTCGTDVKTIRAGHPAAPPYPFTLGHEVVGVVAVLGPDVHDLAVGDRLVVANSAPCLECFFCERGQTTLCERPEYLFGAFAEQIVVPTRIVTRNSQRVPAGLDSRIAALTEPLACAVLAVDGARIDVGDDVAIIGAGPLGLMLCALIVERGGRPIVVDPHVERLELARRFGAAEVVIARRSHADVTRVHAVTLSERGADHVFEAVGRPETWQAALEMARPGGVVTLFGGCPVGSIVSLPTARLHYDQVTMRGSYHHTPATIRRALSILAESTHPWQLLLGPTVGLEDLPIVLASNDGASRPPKFVVDPKMQGLSVALP